jgi:hypothetical protein
MQSMIHNRNPVISFEKKAAILEKLISLIEILRDQSFFL